MEQFVKVMCHFILCTWCVVGRQDLLCLGQVSSTVANHFYSPSTLEVFLQKREVFSHRPHTESCLVHFQFSIWPKAQVDFSADFWSSFWVRLPHLCYSAWQIPPTPATLNSLFYFFSSLFGPYCPVQWFGWRSWQKAEGNVQSAVCFPVSIITLTWAFCLKTEVHVSVHFFLELNTGWLFHHLFSWPSLCLEPECF